jgi:hypothetical protein
MDLPLPRERVGVREAELRGAAASWGAPLTKALSRRARGSATTRILPQRNHEGIGRRDMSGDVVQLEEVMESARRIIIRLDVGSFEISGPRRNILDVESAVAFSTAVNELYKEGYLMVTPEQYAENYEMDLDAVDQKIHQEGGLFLMRYREGDRRDEAVPLEELIVSEGYGPHIR